MYPIRKDSVAFRLIDNEAVILNLTSGIYYSLNEVGSTVWHLCDGNKSVQDIVAVVCEQYEVEESIALEDISYLLNELAREQLIDISKNPPET